MKVISWRRSLIVVALSALFAPFRLIGQEYVVAVAEENFRLQPNGAKLGTLKRGVPVAALGEQGRWVKTSLQGWIWSKSVERSPRKGTVVVRPARENVRAGPRADADVLGTVLRGTELRKLAGRGGWVQVTYHGWIWEPSLAAKPRTAAPRVAAETANRPAVEEAPPAPARTDRTVSAEEENLRAAPRGSRLGTLRRGTDLAVLGSRGEWLEVATRGYFWAASARGSGSSRTVAKAAENLRIAPASEITGVLHTGTPLRVLGRAGKWLEVEVRGWMWRPSTLAVGNASATPPVAPTAGPALAVAGPETADREGESRAEPAAAAPAPATAGPSSRPTAAASSPATTGGRPERVERPEPGRIRTLARSVPLKDGPEGALIGQALTGSAVVPLRSSGDWVKVRLEGWMPKDALASVESAHGPVTVARAVADPEAYRGAEAIWRLELIAVERADASHSDFAPGESYLLTRNAGGEREYVYVAIPERIVTTFEKTRPFTLLTVRGVIRTGRSALVGNPILDFLEVVREKR